MKNVTQDFPICSLTVNSSDCFYPARSRFVTNVEALTDAGDVARISAGPAVPPLTANQLDTWWARAFNQGLPAVGGRYEFLRGPWLPESPCSGWNASASWGMCQPNFGEAC